MLPALPTPPGPPINPAVLAGAGSFIQRLLRGALGVEDIRVAVDQITLLIKTDPGIIRELRPEIHQYLTIEGERATAELLVAWAAFQDSVTRARTADAAIVDQRARRELRALLEENTRLRGQLQAAVAEDGQLREALHALLARHEHGLQKDHEHGSQKDHDREGYSPLSEAPTVKLRGSDAERRVRLDLYDLLDPRHGGDPRRGR
jgi:hypothetical protein